MVDRNPKGAEERRPRGCRPRPSIEFSRPAASSSGSGQTDHGVELRSPSTILAPVCLAASGRRREAWCGHVSPAVGGDRRLARGRRISHRARASVVSTTSVAPGRPSTRAYPPARRSSRKDDRTDFGDPSPEHSVPRRTCDASRPSPSGGRAEYEIRLAFAEAPVRARSGRARGAEGDVCDDEPLRPSRPAVARRGRAEQSRQRLPQSRPFARIAAVGDRTTSAITSTTTASASSWGRSSKPAGRQNRLPSQASPRDS